MPYFIPERDCLFDNLSKWLARILPELEQHVSSSVSSLQCLCRLLHSLSPYCRRRLMEARVVHKHVYVSKRVFFWCIYMNKRTLCLCMHTDIDICICIFWYLWMHMLRCTYIWCDEKWYKGHVYLNAHTHIHNIYIYVYIFKSLWMAHIT